MSQIYHCRHGGVWLAGQAPECELCRDMRLGFIRAALQGISGPMIMEESSSLGSIAGMAIRLADKVLVEAEERR